MLTATAPPVPRPLPPVLGRLLSGTFWLALRTPLQAIFAFWTVPLILRSYGEEVYGAFGFAWGFGFLQFLLEFGMSSGLQRQVSEAWTRGDRAAVDRAVAAGMRFYAAMSVLQAAALLGIAYLGLSQARFHGESARLIVKLLWLQALMSPCFGLSTVVSSVLQAARRYSFIPRSEMAIVILRFAILMVGVRLEADFFAIVVTQTLAQVGLSLIPALWVMVRDLGYVPHFRGARVSDFRALAHISFFMFLIQLSVVLATKIDTTILGFVLADPERAVARYNIAGKPFDQIRQTAWMLAYLVMPAVASLLAARDDWGLDRVKYDGPRLHLGLLLPVALLAWIYAGPFLSLWVGPEFRGEIPELTYLMRLFLVAAIPPLALSVHIQMAIGMGRIKVIALAALAGALVNLPVSYFLTVRLGRVDGVIWGTVLTTLVSNLLVPGFHIFRVLEIRPRAFLTRTLSAPAAGALGLLAATWAFSAWVAPEPKGPTSIARALPFLASLTVGSLAYLAGYLAVPAGRADLAVLSRKVWRRPAPARLE